MRYVTFGYNHRHVIDGKVFDHNCIALIDGDSDAVFAIFGRKWCFEYAEDDFPFESLHLYPRGIIRL